ncbi:hypothetical protein C8E03_10349 [Lachnotalea glycerini]|uniref:Glycosyltransferase RgtA/B/C/D-like domain-containing protein n=1 Tax=Lachnotalea glycerini TaxID=1763509 RepID=A0A255IJX9_9FIRM|nr:hypothetical protein [Lachnotalea glycerini]PXV91493.1 hypothetical protein C8E03_10349 [Lachnotalea glycerini]RDY30530.1 hypothetical protein CG710_014080 [Lachnotalea glycerini]
MPDRIRKTFYLFSIILLALFMFIIVIFTFMNLDYADYLSGIMKGVQVPLFLLTGAIFLFAFVHVAGIPIERYNQKQRNRCAAIVGILIAVIQIMVIYFIRSPLRSDPGMVFDQALDMFQSGTISPTAIEGYFSIYPNNIPLCIYEHLILKLGGTLGLNYKYFLLYLDFINVVFIDLAMFFAYRIIQMLFTGTKALKFLVLSAMNPLLYAYTILVYTSTLSMPFIMGLIYFFLLALREKKAVNKVIYTILATLIFYFGFQLRVTVIITLLAIGIYMLLQRREKLNKAGVLRLVKSVFIIAVTLALAGGCYHILEKKYVKFDYSQTAFPVTHWLMMGAQGSGGFNTEDFNYTFSLPTKEERVQANLEEYKRRISDLGVDGTIHLILNKLKVTWSDGLDATIDSLSDNKTYYAVNDYLTGSKKDIFVSYCHMYNLLLMILVLISAVRGLKRRFDQPVFIISLNLLGGIIFHLIWETGAAYNICFTFLVLILANDGQEWFCMHMKKNKAHRALMGTCALGLVSTTLFLFAGYHEMVEVPFKQYPIAANQDFHENECPALLSGDEIVQTFVTNRAFNRIGIKVRNFTGEENTSLYKVQLLDEENQVIVTDEVVGSLAFDTDYYRIPLETIVPDKATTYKLKITTQKADENHNIVFMMYNTGNWNIYEDGKLSLNGEETRGSLTFQIYQSLEESFLSPKKYLALAVFLLALELFLSAILLIQKPDKETSEK